ncbi:MAG: ABC transporter permease [Geodermatophilaceae bacterium]
MTTTDTARADGGAVHAGSGPAFARPLRGQAGRAFVALLWRDVFVTGRELVAFLAQVILQPLFLLFVFGKVLGDLGYTQGNFAQVLLPGVIAFTAFLTALQNTAFPLVIDFSYTKEIEDRLLAPLPTTLVAVEKVVFATLRALIAAALMFPLGWWVLGSVSITWSAVPAVAMFLVLGALVGAAVGLTIGTLVTASKINLVFAIVLTPLLFTGSTQFPWLSLDNLRWFQVICAFNPLTYVSEGMRGEMLPGVDHIPVWVCALALLFFLAVFMGIGTKGFLRRAID